MAVIDVWGQITTERMAKAPWLATLLRWTGQEDNLAGVNVPATLAAMDEAGVDKMLISAWHGPQGDLITNEEVSDQIDAAPDRFRGLATVDLNDPMSAVRDIRKWAELSDENGKNSSACAWCRGCGIYRPTTGVIIRSMRLALTPAYHSVHRLAIPAP